MIVSTLFHLEMFRERDLGFLYSRNKEINLIFDTSICAFVFIRSK